ncbi:MAG TPA: hypothetical protein PKL31_06180 [Fulvivirga sp.]|nr:hypothetical protein [Fulvivirga sp.]
MRYIKNENVDDIPYLVHIIYFMLATCYYSPISVSTHLAYFYPISDSWRYGFCFASIGESHSLISI